MSPSPHSTPQLYCLSPRDLLPQHTSLGILAQHSRAEQNSFFFLFCFFPEVFLFCSVNFTSTRCRVRVMARLGCYVGPGYCGKRRQRCGTLSSPVFYPEEGVEQVLSWGDAKNGASFKEASLQCLLYFTSNPVPFLGIYMQLFIPMTWLVKWITILLKFLLKTNCPHISQRNAAFWPG